MPPGVVDGLETVKIHLHDDQRAPGQPLLDPLPPERLAQRPFQPRRREVGDDQALLGAGVERLGGAQRAVLAQETDDGHGVGVALADGRARRSLRRP
jgi:hypothetical protein